MTPEEAKALYRLAWFSYIGMWGRGRQHRWRLSEMGHWMDLLQVATEMKGEQWVRFAATVPGLPDYWSTPVSWKRHRGVKPRHPEE